ncbi:MAG: hypothetical protein V4525_11635 [Pseudomonadota bacterium]
MFFFEHVVLAKTNELEKKFISNSIQERLFFTPEEREFLDKNKLNVFVDESKNSKSNVSNSLNKAVIKDNKEEVAPNINKK